MKLFTPDAACTWLLSELDPENPDIAFGLADLGMGCPELGRVSISELESVHGKLGLPVERDLYFMPTKTISAYAEQAPAIYLSAWHSSVKRPEQAMEMRRPCALI